MSKLTPTKKTASEVMAKGKEYTRRVVPVPKDEPKSAPFKLVRVDWEDSARPIPTWQWVDEYEVPSTVCCTSVGFLIAETNKALALAPNLGDTTQDRIQASGIIRIPRSAVRKMREL
jgi:hypothetical protein